MGDGSKGLSPFFVRLVSGQSLYVSAVILITDKEILKIFINRRCMNKKKIYLCIYIFIRNEPIEQNSDITINRIKIFTDN